MEKGYRILDMINAPSDLKVLSIAELEILAEEIRNQIVETASKTGGHVASSLGAVEIILSAHSMLNCPKDKLVFDVGHQAYAHKLVTGRRDIFSELRTYNGISGFPNPQESEFDTHPSGHASDSLSVASGLAKAKLLNKTNEKIVAVIGDASLGGGMAFEALNYIGAEQLPMIIILNDNEMSISRNIGALTMHLGQIRATEQYRNTREAIQEKMESGGIAWNTLAELGKRAKDSMKHMFLAKSMIYEQLGIVCTPPIDGNNIYDLREILKICLDMECPVLIHAVTKKGVGFEPAENDPELFHGIGPFDKITGRPIATTNTAPTFTDVFGLALIKEAEKDQDIVAITAAMEGGTGLKAFHERFPERFIDVGIAEEQAVAMASGLAASGKKPVVAIYSTFMQRAIDQAIVDVALPDLDVVFALDRAGLVGDDGATHHGVFDLVYMRMIPNMKIIVPSNVQELANALHTALAISGPVSIRYPRGCGEDVPTIPVEPKLLEIGKSHVVQQGTDVSILAFGRFVKTAQAAAEILASEDISTQVIDMIWAKPLDETAIKDAASRKLVVTLEDGIIEGGVGEEIQRCVLQFDKTPSVLTLGIPDRFIMQGKSNQLFEEIGLDAQGVATSIKRVLAQQK